MVMQAKRYGDILVYSEFKLLIVGVVLSIVRLADIHQSLAGVGPSPLGTVNSATSTSRSMLMFVQQADP